MNILFDLNHPAHVHLFRNTMKHLQSSGHNVVITAREKEVTTHLLDRYHFKYTVLSKAHSGLLGLGFELIERQAKLIPILKKNNIQLCVSVTGASSIHIARLMGIPYYIFHDSESAELQNAIAYPFATKIFTPDCYRLDHGKKHVRYAGFHELAYLHPDVFTPNPETLIQCGLKNNERFFVMRFVAWKASHDVGRFGFSPEEKVKIIQELEKHGRIFITSEKPLDSDLEKYRITIPPDKLHDLLYYANLLITDSQTVTTEAALLGTPAVRYNSFAGENDMGNFIELEKKYGLIYSFNSFPAAHQKVQELLVYPDLKLDWNIKRAALLKDKINVSEWMTRQILSTQENHA